MAAFEIIALDESTPQLRAPGAGDTLVANQTWNNAGTTFKALEVNVTDTASASGSLLMDLRLGGLSVFSVAKTDIAARLANGYSVAFRASSTINGHAVGRLSFLGFSNSNQVDLGGAGGGIDTRLYRDAANTLALRYSTNPQAFNIYSSYSDASNYERLAIKWDTNRAVIDTEEAGTGSARGITIGGADLILSGLPTADPAVAGQLWNNSGALAVSAG